MSKDRRSARAVSGWLRVNIQCRNSDNPEYLASDDVISDLVATTLEEQYRDHVSWVSTYQFKQIIADMMSDDYSRILLTGEVRHLFAPFGACGMNSGTGAANRLTKESAKPS